MTGTSRKRIGIADRIGLAQVIRRTLETQFDGSQSQAADASGIPQYQLSRLLNLEQRLDAITPETREQLEHLVGPKGKTELQRMFLSPGADQFIDVHRGWVARALQRVLKGTGLGWWGWSATAHSVTKRALSRRQLIKARQDWLASLQAIVRSQMPEQCNRFDGTLRAAGHRRDRIALAYVRILEPLLDSFESGLIERGWYELRSAGQLQEFVECGMRREEILLTRESDVQRAHQLSLMETEKEFRSHYGYDGGEPSVDLSDDGRIISRKAVEGRRKVPGPTRGRKQG